MKHVAYNSGYKAVDSQDADRLVFAPAPGDTVHTDDGRSGTVVSVKWKAVGSKLVTATVQTENFACSLGDVAYVENREEKKSPEPVETA